MLFRETSYYMYLSMQLVIYKYITLLFYNDICLILHFVRKEKLHIRFYVHFTRACICIICYTYITTATALFTEFESNVRNWISTYRLRQFLTRKFLHIPICNFRGLTHTDSVCTEQIAYICVWLFWVLRRASTLAVKALKSAKARTLKKKRSNVTFERILLF